VRLTPGRPAGSCLYGSLTSSATPPCSTHHLWTDATARLFIQTHYPSFLATYDSYEYNIQRADAIRYFVLHRYGGIYMDLDVSAVFSGRVLACERRSLTLSFAMQIGIVRDPTPLLRGDWDVILAKTIPVSADHFECARSPWTDKLLGPSAR
jgi:hypothetical protein